MRGRLFSSALAAYLLAGVPLALPLALLPSPDSLTPLDLLRIEEFHRIRRRLGEEMWPGWGAARTPFVLRKGSREYLIDHPHPPAGFVREAPPAGDGPAVFRGGALPVPFLALTAFPVEGVPTVIAIDKRGFDRLRSCVGAGHDSLVRAALTAAEGAVDTALYEGVLLHEGFHALPPKRGDGNDLLKRAQAGILIHDGKKLGLRN